MYKVYAETKQLHWDLIKNCDTLEEVEESIENIDTDKYFKYMVKEHTEKGDNYIKSGEFYKECFVEYSVKCSDKVNFEVKATTFKPSKMKQKEELRKEIDKYIRE